MGGRLKVGLIVDSERVSRHVHELAQWASQTEAVSITHLIVQPRPASTAPRAGVLKRVFRKSPAAHATVALWKAKARLESRVVARMPAYRGHQESRDMGELVPGRIRVTPLVSR